jgi:hypothetical protein
MEITQCTFVFARIDYDTLLLMRGSSFQLHAQPGHGFHVGYNDDLTYNGNSPSPNNLTWLR